MKEDLPKTEIQRGAHEDPIHVSPEMAVAEAEVISADEGELVVGTSLWPDAWRRLLKNKLAVFGLLVVILITAGAIVGPWLIKATTGYTYDYIPSDANLIRSLPPFRSADGSFSWAHPWGTANSGRDSLGKGFLGGRISLMVG